MSRLLAASILSICCASSPAQSGVWLDVPFVKQPREGCGAATVAMVIGYWHQQQGRGNDRASDVNYIQQALYSKQAHGIRASQLRDYFEQQGFETYVFSGDAELLAHHLARGRPLIAALQPTAGAPLHYVVIAGIESGQNIVLINDPAARKLLKVGLSSFESQWRATGHWTLLAVPRSDRR